MAEAYLNYCRTLSISNEPDVLDTAATLYYNIGEIQEAYHLYRQLLAMEPQNTQYALNYVSHNLISEQSKDTFISIIP